MSIFSMKQTLKLPWRKDNQQKYAWDISNQLYSQGNEKQDRNPSEEIVHPSLPRNSLQQKKPIKKENHEVKKSRSKPEDLDPLPSFGD